MPDKQLISQNFSASAMGYDRHSLMQREMADRLLSLLPSHPIPHTPYPIPLTKILDLGCGTGYLTAKLAEQFPSARVEGVDIASGMIAVAEKHQRKNLSFKVGDGEEVSGRDYDLVVSNASLQWMSIEKAFARVVALLKPGGLFVFTTFGPKTLIELKECGFRVNEFPDTIAIEQLLKPNFHNVFLASQVYHEEFPGVKELIYYLKELGAQTSDKDEVFSPAAFRRYREQYSTTEGVTASFEPIYGVFRRRQAENA